MCSNILEKPGATFFRVTQPDSDRVIKTIEAALTFSVTSVHICDKKLKNLQEINFIYLGKKNYCFLRHAA
jgi:hypothetical protein